MTERRLLTIPISHFCEKARWALERAGLAYREERHVQGIHSFAARRAGGGSTVPVLVTPAGAIGESREIVEWVDDMADEMPQAANEPAEVTADDRPEPPGADQITAAVTEIQRVLRDDFTAAKKPPEKTALAEKRWTWLCFDRAQSAWTLFGRKGCSSKSEPSSCVLPRL